jgi:hypothetical protein
MLRYEIRGIVVGAWVKYINNISIMVNMIEMTPEDVALAKDLMWRHGLTRREAVCYVANSNGMSAHELARQAGVSAPLISKRISGARRKLESIVEDGEL